MGFLSNVGRLAGPCVGLERLDGERHLVDEDHLLASGDAAADRSLQRFELVLVVCLQLGLISLPVAVARPHLLVGDAPALVFLTQRCYRPPSCTIALIQQCTSLRKVQMSLFAKGLLADVLEAAAAGAE